MSVVRGWLGGEGVPLDRQPDRADKAAGRRFRHRSVVLMRRNGCTNAEITAALGYTPQHIRRIVQADERRKGGGRAEA